jgi:PKD repeat protein
VALPGYTALPGDPNADCIYEDLNANGRLDFADIVLYFSQMSWIAANEPIEGFDLNYNGRIDFADIIVLFTRV